jgi:hypothetical protein
MQGWSNLLLERVTVIDRFLNMAQGYLKVQGFGACEGVSDDLDELF